MKIVIGFFLLLSSFSLSSIVFASKEGVLGLSEQNLRFEQMREARKRAFDRTKDNRSKETEVLQTESSENRKKESRVSSETSEQSRCFYLRQLVENNSVKELQDLIRKHPELVKRCTYGVQYDSIVTLAVKNGTKEVLDELVRENYGLLRTATPANENLIEIALSNKKNSEYIIKYLIEKDRGLLDGPSTAGPLIAAFKAGNEGAFRQLLRSDRDVVYIKSSRGRETCLFYFASLKKVEKFFDKDIRFARIVLEERPDLLSFKTEKMTVASYSVFHGNIDFLNLLFQFNTKLFGPDQDNFPILDFLLKEFEVNSEKKEALIRRIVQVSPPALLVPGLGRSYPIHSAVRKRLFGLVRLFVEADSKQLQLTTKEGETAERLAESQTNREVYNYLVQARQKTEASSVKFSLGKASVESRDFKETPIHAKRSRTEEAGDSGKSSALSNEDKVKSGTLAYQESPCGQLKNLVSENSLIALKNFLNGRRGLIHQCRIGEKRAESIVAHAVRVGTKAVLSELVGEELELLRTTGMHGQSLIELAFSNYKYAAEVIEYLVEKDRGLLNHGKIVSGPLVSAFMKDCESGFRQLLKSDRDVVYFKQNSKYRQNFLFYLASFKDEKSLEKAIRYAKVFLEYRSDLLSEKSEKMTVAALAAFNHNARYLEFLLGHDSSLLDPEKSDFPILNFLLKDARGFETRESLVRMIVQKSPRTLMVRSRSLDYPIHAAVGANEFNLVKLFIDTDSKQLELKTEKGDTPEDLAKYLGKDQIYQYLVDARRKMEAAQATEKSTSLGKATAENRVIEESSAHNKRSRVEPAEPETKKRSAEEAAAVIPVPTVPDADETSSQSVQRKASHDSKRRRNIVVSSEDEETVQEALRKPVELVLSRSNGSVHLARSLQDKDEVPFREPKPESPKKDHAVSESTIQFLQVKKEVSTQAPKIEEIGIKGRYSFKYMTLAKTLPSPNERLTIVLAESGLDSLYPQEKEGGRVVFLIDRTQSSSITRLLGPHEDVCVIETMKLGASGEFLSDDERKQITVRRIAAFKVAEKLGSLKNFAMIDDGIQSVEVKEDSFFEDGNLNPESKKTWSSFYSAAVSYFQQSEVAMIGFKHQSPYSNRTQLESATLKLVDQGPKENSNSFGKRIFFFNFEKIRSHLPSFGSKYENLFPRDPFLPLEEQYLQLALAEVGLKVTHFHPDVVSFKKSGKKKGNPKEKAKAWLKNLSDPLPFRKNVLDRVHEIVLKNIAHSTKKRDQQRQTDLVQAVSRPQFVPAAATPPVVEQILIPARTQKALAKIRKPTVSTPIPDGLYLFSEYDSQADWNNFKNELSAANFEDLWKHQNDALQALGRILHQIPKDHSRTFLFEMATGTGKSKTEARIAELAQKNLNGNIIFISPRLVLKDQLTGSLENLHYFPVSSKSLDVAAGYAAMNDDFAEGKKAALFCEASFREFVMARNGDLGDVSLIIVDEVHMMNPKTLEILERLRLNKKGAILGFSATARVEKVTPIFKKLAFLYDTEKAVKDGILTPWITETVTHVGEEKVTPENVNELIPAILKRRRHPQSGAASARQGIIYLKKGSTVGDVDRVVALLNQANINALPYHYLMNKTDGRGQDEDLVIQKTSSKDALENYKNGNTRFLVAIELLREGLDIDPVDVIVIADPDPGIVAGVQMRGRSLRNPRRDPNKRPLILTINPELTRKLMWTGDPKYRAVQDQHWERRFQIRQ